VSERFIRYSRYFKHIHILVDTLLLNLSFLVAFNIRFANEGKYLADNGDYLRLLLFFNIVWLLLLYISKPYNKTRIESNLISGVFASSLMVVFLHGFIISSFWVVFKAYFYSREHLILTYFLFVALLLVWKILFVSFLKYYRLKGYNSRNVLIVGNGQLADELNVFFKKHPELGYKLHNLPTSVALKNKENATLISEYSEQHEIHEIYCCLPQMSPEIVQQIIAYGEEYKVKIKLISDFRGFISKGVDLEYLDYIPVLNISKSSIEDVKSKIIKRTFDIGFSLCVLIIGLPIYLIVGLITKLTSEGPMFYSQERIGRWGKPFKIYKFRSMYINAEAQGPKLCKDFDPRVTPWGRFMRKTRLDEIPQFYNVLIGNMSVVGPRPERQHFIDQIVELAPHYRKLHTVKPGITSIGQIMFGYAENVEQMVKRLRYDILYLNNISVGFDMKLVALTLKVMVQGKGK